MSEEGCDNKCQSPQGKCRKEHMRAWQTSRETKNNITCLQSSLRKVVWDFTLSAENVELRRSRAWTSQVLLKMLVVLHQR